MSSVGGINLGKREIPEHTRQVSTFPTTDITLPLTQIPRTRSELLSCQKDKEFQFYSYNSSQETIRTVQTPYRPYTG